MKTPKQVAGRKLRSESAFQSSFTLDFRSDVEQISVSALRCGVPGEGENTGDSSSLEQRNMHAWTPRPFQYQWSKVSKRDISD